MNVNEKVSSDLCCGCGLCKSVCPTKAIAFDCNNDTWHLYPRVQPELCIDCSKCVKLCPAVNDKTFENFEPYGFAAVADDDVRKKSASGGMFYLLAKHIISKRGYVVGAVYDEDLNVKHIVSNSLHDIERMRGSKYVQSDASEAYGTAVKLLSEGKTVLFSGTPCQVEAMKRAAKGKEKRLICVDILCHGTPSPRVFDYYLRENFNKSDIQNVIFRNKKHRNGTPGSLTVVMKDGREYYSEYFDNTYYNAFLGNITERASCNDCKFAEFPRVGDISIGDFWGAKTTETAIDYEKGCSVVFINSQNGERLWKHITHALKTAESYPLDVLMSWNRNKRELSHNRRASELPSQISRHHSLRTATDNLIYNRYDIGIYGATMNPNFGGLITYWALYEVIKALGYSVALIDKPRFNKSYHKRTHSTDFFENRCEIIGKEIELCKIPNLNNQVDGFIIGSDQVWNYSLFGAYSDSFYLDFANNDKLKLAYAASFGHDYHACPEDRRGQVSKHFKQFDRIGVRERDAVKILKDNYGVDSTHVLDPVLLIDSSKYKELAEESQLSGKAPKRFVGTYIIEPTDFKLSVVKSMTEHLGIENLNTTDGDQSHFQRKSAWFKDRSMHIQHDASVQDWLYIILNSDFVVTDSFHAVCFCIIFKKPFILLQERWALSRIESLLSTFSLKERWLQLSSIDEFSIDESWFEPLPSFVGDVLCSERERCISWLSDALASSKTVHEIKKFTPYFDKTRVEDYFYFLMRGRRDFVITVTSSCIDKGILSRIDFKSKLSFEDFQTDNSTAFAMICDYDGDFIVSKNEKYSEIRYECRGKTITCIADASCHPYTNNVYIDHHGRRDLLKLSTENGVYISIYSKLRGELIDSFSVIDEDGTLTIKR